MCLKKMQHFVLNFSANRYPSHELPWTTSVNPVRKTCPGISSGNACTSITILQCVQMCPGRTTRCVHDTGMSMLRSDVLAALKHSNSRLLNKSDGTKNSDSTSTHTPKTVLHAGMTNAIGNYFDKNMIVT